MNSESCIALFICLISFFEKIVLLTNESNLKFTETTRNLNIKLIIDLYDSLIILNRKKIRIADQILNNNLMEVIYGRLNF
jgi:hypothetical protein